MNYALHILILVNLYVALGVSLNLLAGYSGLLSFAHAGFYGLGAYTTALLTLRLDWPWLGTVPAACAIVGLLAYMIGKIALQFRDDYFVIVTFAFQIILYSLMLNWTRLTHGPMGLPGIKQPKLFGLEVDTQLEFLALSICFSLVVVVCVQRLVQSPYGRRLKAIREDENFAAAVGVNVAACKASAFTIGAVFAAFAGSLYAGYYTFIDPSSFTVQESILILAIVIVGGAGSIRGTILGAVLLVSLPELLRFVNLSSLFAANVRQMLYGLALVVCMIWRPKGLLGDFSFSREERR